MATSVQVERLGLSGYAQLEEPPGSSSVSKSTESSEGPPYACYRHQGRSRRWHICAMLVRLVSVSEFSRMRITAFLTAHK